MFFGNGLARPFFELLATHPPLAERIRRIDPSFNGKFPQVEKVTYSADDVVDPHTLAMQRAAGTNLHAEATAGAQSFAFQPETAVAHVGAPRLEHLDYAAARSPRCHPTWLPTSGIRSARWLRSMPCCSMIGSRRSARISSTILPSRRTHDRTKKRCASRRWPAKSSRKAKLPLVGMVLPALQRLSPRQLSAFRDDVTFLIKADNQVSLFEYAVHRLVLKRLLPRLEQAQLKR